MKTTKAYVVFTTACLASGRFAQGFQTPAFSVTSKVSRPGVVRTDRASSSAIGMFSFGKKEQKVEEIEDVATESWTDFGSTPQSYAYGGAWLLLLSYSFIFAPGELNAASDTAMLQSIIANPAAPDMNPFYYGFFNLFALIPIVLGCTVAPRASNEGIPAGAPIFLSGFFAYFVMGPYLALRKEPKESITDPSTDFGWITRNVWENKIFNYFTVAFGILCLAAGAPGLEDPAASFNGFVELFQTSRFAAISLADVTLITLILTKEVADDYKIRCSPENVDKAALIGASTALFPLLGAAVYCALRPSIEE
mmetsp:Transcript_11817/g.17919  ORF Transcript_11817/g.17919 Transcript_11817/m.17919 type:complete len:309 (+) Transcript_11817:57-983(+)